jgi:hypothetical protein
MERLYQIFLLEQKYLICQINPAFPVWDACAAELPKPAIHPIRFASLEIEEALSSLTLSSACRHKSFHWKYLAVSRLE